MKLFLTCTISLLTILSLSNAYGADGSAKEKEHPKKEESHKGGDKSHGEKSSAGGKEEKKPEAPPAKSGPKREYNPGKVIPFPKFSAETIHGDKTIDFAPKKGRASLLIFVSSWCEPCQVLMMDLKQLARKYAAKNTDVFFVFAHDTKPDAQGFFKEYQIPQTALIANVEILTVFKNPEVPSIYIGDKWGYIADRYIKLKKSDIELADQSLAKLTAL